MTYPRETNTRNATAVMLKGGNLIDGIESVRTDAKGMITVATRDDGVSYESEFHVSAVSLWEYAVKAGA